MDDWTAAQWADECARMRQVIDALLEAEARGTPPDVIELLASECGVSKEYQQEKKQ